MDKGTLRSIERTLSAGTWIIVCGAVVYSVLTVTPLVAAHTAPDWRWTAPLLPVVVDTAVVIVVRLDSVLARLEARGGRWPVTLRWMTGVMTLSLNIADSALKGDGTGVAIHAVAPLLLIVTSEAGLAYRRALAAALARQAQEREAQRSAREQAEREREREQRDERQAAREAEERRERERREHEARMAREEREHAAQQAREQREAEREREQRAHEQAQREREQQQQAREREQRRRAEAEEARRQAEAERKAREAEAEQRRQQEARERRERLLAAGPAAERQQETTARETVRAAYEAGLSIRSAAELCGWSIGWVTSRYHELRPELAGTGAGTGGQ